MYKKGRRKKEKRKNWKEMGKNEKTGMAKEREKTSRGYGNKVGGGRHSQCKRANMRFMV